MELVGLCFALTNNDDSGACMIASTLVEKSIHRIPTLLPYLFAAAFQNKVIRLDTYCTILSTKV
jgi:hypothetical protein